MCIAGYCLHFSLNDVMATVAESMCSPSLLTGTSLQIKISIQDHIIINNNCQKRTHLRREQHMIVTETRVHCIFVMIKSVKPAMHSLVAASRLDCQKRSRSGLCSKPPHLRSVGDLVLNP